MAPKNRAALCNPPKHFVVLYKGEKVWGAPVKPSTYVTPDETARYDLGLFEQLRAKRKELADAERVPPYMIFSDRALQEMATYFPHSAVSFERMHGVGQVKIEKYADIFLPIIHTYCQEHGLTEKPKSTLPSVKFSKPFINAYQEESKNGFESRCRWS